MPFELDKGDSYPWTVRLQEPADRRAKPETFTAIFKRLSQVRIDEINEEIRQRMIAAQAGESVDGLIDDMRIAEEVLVGWSDITSNGSQVPFSEELKSELINRAQFAAAIVFAWNESLTEGRKKTLKTPQGIA